MSVATHAAPVTILIGALGGEGGGVLAQWIVEAAGRAGFIAQSTSIPGVAQRTGATTYYVEIVPVPALDLGGREPVLSLYPVPGRVDLVVASELLEAGRIVSQGLTSSGRTTMIASTARVLTTAEKMALGDGRFASDRLLAVARRHSRRLVTFDIEQAARDASTVQSAVMFGAVAGSGVLPFARDHCEAVIGDEGASAQASRAGFAAGHAAVSAAANALPAGEEHAASKASSAREAHTARDAAIATGARREDAPKKHAHEEPAQEHRDGASRQASLPQFDALPGPVREFVARGHARVVDFQDVAYGELYLARLARVLAAERAGDPAGRLDHAVTRETARYLALWMAFDDVIRVAREKVAAGRIERIRKEASAAPADVVKVIDHFKPGVPELAGLLPPTLAARVVAFDRARQARGRPPLEWALKLRADSVSGALALRLLAGLRRWRPHGERYRDEQAAIERWLAAIERGTREDVACGLEIALAGRLVKGYGATHQRGRRNLDHVLEHVAGAGFSDADARLAALRAAREAALADEVGTALDRVLVQHGAPARPVVVQPIRWMPRPSRAAGAATRVEP